MKYLSYFLIALLLCFGVMYLLGNWSFSDGERAGTVSKFSRKGYVFKTYEGELSVGGFSGETGTLNPNIWHFSTKTDSVANKLRRAMDTGERVTLVYEEKVLQFSWNGDTKYFVNDVRFQPNKRPTYEKFPQEVVPEAPQAAQPASAPADSVVII